MSLPPELTDRLGPLSWTCMVCGQRRLDARISVAHVPISGMESQFPEVRINVRYCNDNNSCRNGAFAYNPMRTPLRRNPPAPPVTQKPKRLRWGSRILSWFDNFPVMY